MGRIVTYIVHVVYHVSSCDLMRLVCILVIQSCTARMAVCKLTIIICTRRSYMGRIVTSIVYVVYHMSSCALMRLVELHPRNSVLYCKNGSLQAHYYHMCPKVIYGSCSGFYCVTLLSSVFLMRRRAA
mgnify:CR=1 FL=1